MIDAEEEEKQDLDCESLESEIWIQIAQAIPRLLTHSSTLLSIWGRTVSASLCSFTDHSENCQVRWIQSCVASRKKDHAIGPPNISATDRVAISAQFGRKKRRTLTTWTGFEANPVFHGVIRRVGISVI